MKPVIGIVSHFLVKDNLYSIGANYIHAVRDAGGIPLQIPVNRPEAAADLAALADGFLIPGGADVSPLFYGEQPHLKVTRTHRGDDEFEAALIKEAIRQHKPVLGICRGLQIMNVCLGGTLYQDITEQTKDPICHYQDAAARGERTHSISIDPSSLLCRIMGKNGTDVNSHHHQSVREAANGLAVSAISPDGIIEAVESEDGMLMGVQWHPESLYTLYEEHARLFTDFIGRCGGNG